MMFVSGESGILPIFKKKFGNIPLFPNYIGACPCFETQFYQNRVMLDQTKKEKKFAWNSSLGKSSSKMPLKRHYRAP